MQTYEFKNRYNDKVIASQEANSQREALEILISQDANLQRANLQRANLQDANLQWANLQWANLQNANLDFSCWPLHCGSFNAKADDRLVAQLINHVAKLDVIQCSGGVKEAIEYIRKMAIADLFSEYRDGVGTLEEMGIDY